MSDAYSVDSILFVFLVVAVAFVTAKVLAKLGIATKKNSNTVAIVLAVVVGIVYAVTFKFERSFGPFADFLLRIAFGAMVGGVLWAFILMGVGGAVNDEKE